MTRTAASIEDSIPTEYAHIVRTPGVLRGEPRIDGHRIRVRDVAAARDVHGFAPEQIAARAFPWLTLSEIYSTLAYYEDHRGEMERLAREDSEFVEHVIRTHPGLVIDMRSDSEA